MGKKFLIVAVAYFLVSVPIAVAARCSISTVQLSALDAQAERLLYVKTPRNQWGHRKHPKRKQL